MKEYEGLFILRDSLNEEQMAKCLAFIEEEVTKLGGAALEKQIVGKRTFAIKLKKQTSGHYARQRFRLPADKVVALQTRLKFNDSIFRVLITRAPQKPASSAADAASEPENKGETQGGGGTQQSISDRTADARP